MALHIGGLTRLGGDRVPGELSDPRVDNNEELYPAPRSPTRSCSTTWPPWTRRSGASWPRSCGRWPGLQTNLTRTPEAEGRCETPVLDDTAGGLEFNRRPEVAINPGNQTEVFAVFDVPPDTKPTQIVLHDSAYSPGVTVDLT
jgi:hypothetical protein